MNPGTAPVSRRFLIRGRVQGVSYRASARRAALALGLTGWVRNLPDGRVEAIAQGDAALLERFEHWLWQGPAHAEVSEVLVDSPLDEAPHTGFVIR